MIGQTSLANLKTTVTMFASPALMKYSNMVNVSVFQA